jgi:hypothetical protein
MRAPQTIGDWIFFLTLSSMVFIMGVLFFVYPPEAIPEQRRDYTEHSGVLDEVLTRESGRRLSLIKFRLSDDARIYENRSPGIHEISATWQNQRTALRFYTPRVPSNSGSLNSPQMAYGLMADGLATRSLEADIHHANTRISPWAGVLPLGIGSFGYLVAGLVWWRRTRTGRLAS